LAAILFPVFASAQSKAQRTVCTSNLRQLGIAVALYAQDYDDLFPRGGDPSDIETTYWENYKDGKYWAAAQHLPPLTTVLAPDVGSMEVWHCPSDNGIPTGNGLGLPLTLPSSYAVYGTSYYYDTLLYFTHQSLGSVTMYDVAPSHREYGPSEIPVFYDGEGEWHGTGRLYNEQIYNVLMVDGHVTPLSEGALDQTDDENRQFSLP
jgi:prepilin-type processing-associated H-X9-DG protein